MINNEFAGLNGFVWWIGVVEDRGDPLRLGRCRVRIAGWHSEKITEVPTNSLPWAQAMMPVNNPNTYTPKESDMVVGFFLDGENAQQPVIMGVLPGIPLVNSNEKTGFGDTRTSKQIDIAPAKPGEDKTPYPRYLDEPTTSRLARNEQPTQINLLNQLSSSKANKYGVEQPPSYNARYPYNNAIETESGHAFELDDTPEYERINLMHRTGSHIEFRPEGSVQQKIMNNSTKTVGKDEVVHIKGNQLIYIDGDLTYKVGGSVTFLVEKNFAVSAKNISLSAKSNFSASAQLSASVSGYLSSSLGGLTSVITSVAGLKTTVSGKGSLDATSSGKATFGGTGTIINGATIALVNTPVAAAEGAASESANNPPAEGSPFTSPTVNPATASISSSAIDNATALYGTPTPDVGTIIGKSVSDQSYLNNVIYGPTSYNWTNASQVTQSMSVVNPSFLDSLRTDLQNGATAIKNYGVKLGSDLYTQSGIPALSQSYDKADALISTAQQTGKLADYSKAASATVDVIGKGTQVGVNITSFNRDAINASDFVKNSCLVQSGKQWVNSVTQPLQDGWDKIKEDIKETQNKIKDLDPKLRERLSELRKSIDEFDEKSLDEFINANHKDQACKYCAEEAAEKLRSEVDRKTVSDGISNCLYREYLAFKKTYASKFPITEGKATENLKKSC